MSAPGVERAVRQAQRSPCPNAIVPMFAWSQTTDRAYEMACGSWVCSYCRRKKRAAVALVVAEGCHAAFVRGERVRFLTLTDGSGGDMTVRELYLAWNRLRASLRKLGYLREYAAVVETTKNGALHLHVVATGRFVPQKLLSRLASQAGFGKVADIRQVRRDDDGKGTAAYVAKDMAAYVAKEQATGPRATSRRRPFRCSRGWGLSLAEAERLIAEAWAAERDDEARDPGPWVVVVRRSDGTLLVRGEGLRHASDEAAAKRQRSGGRGASSGASPSLRRLPVSAGDRVANER